MGILKILGYKFIPYIDLSCLAIRATQGRPYNLGVLDIDIIPCIYIFCIPIWAAQGRPYRVANDFVGAGLSVGACLFMT